MAISNHERVVMAMDLLKGGRSFRGGSDCRYMHGYGRQCLRRAFRQQPPFTVTSVDSDFKDLLAATDESRSRKHAA